MRDNDRQFSLPGKLDSYLATLNRLYERKGEALLREIVVNAIPSIHEGWDYDNWDGGTHGHAVTLTLTEELFLQAIDEKEEIRSRLALDLNKLNNVPNEQFSEVFIEMEPSGNENWRAQTGVLQARVPAISISADALNRIWGSGHVRVFLSHKSSVKRETASLKQSLARCGLAAFVAHEDIEPTQEWHREIERALFSMDTLVALLTDDYHNSNWTDQEVGVAIGRGVPLIAVRLGMDPYGLMGKGQGLGGCSFEDTDGIAIKVFELLKKNLPDKSRLFECAVAAFAASESYADSAWKVNHLLRLFENPTTSQIEQIVEAFKSNSQNRDSFKGRERLRQLLGQWTGKTWKFNGTELVALSEEEEQKLWF